MAHRLQRRAARASPTVAHSKAHNNFLPPLPSMLGLVFRCGGTRKNAVLALLFLFGDTRRAMRAYELLRPYLGQ